MTIENACSILKQMKTDGYIINLSKSIEINNNGFNNNNMMNFLPYLMQQNGQNNKNLSQDFIQTMMMTQMMPDFSFDTSNK